MRVTNAIVTLMRESDSLHSNEKNLLTIALVTDLVSTTDVTMDFGDPLLSSNSLFNIISPRSGNTATTVGNVSVGPPSPPWECDPDLATPFDLGVDAKMVDDDEFLSLSPESLRLDSETDEAISSFLTSVTSEEAEATVAKCLDDLDDLDCLSTTSSDAWSNSTNNNNEPVVSDIPVKTDGVSHCSVCKLVFSSASLLDEHAKSYAGRMACCHCNKTFGTTSKLRIHHRKHSKEKPYQCQVCGKYYTHRNTLARHQLLYCRPLRAKFEDATEIATSESDTVVAVTEPETVEFVHLTNVILQAEVVLDQPKSSPAKRSRQDKKPATKQQQPPVTALTPGSASSSKTKCIVCDKEFFDADSLENHKEYHLSHRECCHCHKVLGNKSKLLTHHRSHTKENPYSCRMCGKSFAELSTLRKHEATHGERNFRCNLCQKAFVRKDYLAKHSLTHRQTYKCSECSFVSHNRLDIERHVADNHGSKK